MSEDWKPGDEAQCLKRDKWVTNMFGLPTLVDGPQFMNIYPVLQVVPVEGRVFLELEGFEGVWLSDFFRKPDPLDLDEEDSETVGRSKDKELEPS